MLTLLEDESLSSLLRDNALALARIFKITVSPLPVKPVVLHWAISSVSAPIHSKWSVPFIWPWQHYYLWLNFIGKNKLISEFEYFMEDLPLVASELVMAEAKTAGNV